MGFTYKRCPDSDKDLERGDFESEPELNTPSPDLSAYLSSLEQQQQQLAQQLEQHEEQIQQLQEEQGIKELQEQMEEIQGKQELQEQQNKTQSRWERLIKYDLDGFWNVKLSELGCWFISFIVIVFVSTMIFMGIVLDHAAAPGDGSAALTPSPTPTASGVKMGTGS